MIEGSHSEWYTCEDCKEHKSIFKICDFHIDIMTAALEKKYGWAMPEISYGLMRIHGHHIGESGCLWFFEDETYTLHCIHGLVLHDSIAVMWTTGGGRN